MALTMKEVCEHVLRMSHENTAFFRKPGESGVPVADLVPKNMGAADAVHELRAASPNPEPAQFYSLDSLTELLDEIIGTLATNTDLFALSEVHRMISAFLAGDGPAANGVN